MSFLLQSCNCTNCQTEKIIFEDGTGLYANNGTGFGTPNLAFADISSATLDVIYPNGTTAQTFDITAAVIANAAGNYEREFSPSDFGLETFEDGWYTITYNVAGTVSGSPVSYKSVKKSFYYCGLKCCVTKAAVVAVTSDRSCCDDCNKTKRYKKMKTALELMQDSICCPNEEAVNLQWERLKKLCASGDCGCK